MERARRPFSQCAAKMAALHAVAQERDPPALAASRRSRLSRSARLKMKSLAADGERGTEGGMAVAQERDPPLGYQPNQKPKGMAAG